MASTPGRQRGSRPQVQNEIGTYGRTTGIKPPDPKKVHRDSNGLENPEDFFNRAERSSEAEDEEGGDSQQSGTEQSDSESDDLGNAANHTRASVKQSAKKRSGQVARRGARPDKFIPGEGRGRKTGAVVAEGRRDSDGLEDPDEFFNNANVSSPTGSVATTSYQSSIRRTTQSSRTTAQYGGAASSSRSQRTEYFEDDEEMGDGDTTTLSPTTYQKRTQTVSASMSVSGSTARKPSSLRQSTLPSGSHSVSSKGLSKGRRSSVAGQTEEEFDGEEEEEEEFDEEGSEEPEVIANNSSKRQRRRFSSLTSDTRRRAESVDTNQEEPIIEEYDLASDGVHDGEGDTTMGDRTIQGEVIEEDDDGSDLGNENSRITSASKSSSGRKSLASSKGGKVDKGKGRAVSESEPEEEQEEEDSSTSRKKSRVTEISSNSQRESRRSSVGLVKLDKNGKATPVVDKKTSGKGKEKEVVRSPSPRYDDYAQDDFGGGGDDDEEAANFNYGGDDPDESLPQIEDEEVEPEQEQEEEEEEEEEQPEASTSKAKSKEKKKSKTKQKVVKPASSSSKGRSKKRSSDASDSSQETVTAKRARRAPSQMPEEMIERIPRDRDAGSVEVNGVRRSNRQRLPPLDYWRNERIVYKKRASGVGMAAIVRIPKLEPEPLTQAGRKKRSKSSAPRSKGPSKRARSVKSESEEEDEEDRIDSMTDPDGLVWSWEGNAETTRRIAFTENMMDPKPAFNNQYQFQKIYQELDYLAGGILDIPVGGKKDTKPAKDNSYLFYCARGSVSVLCHRTRVAIGKGGTFFIPRGNSYSIEATSNRPVRLFFAQGRRVIELEDGATRPDTQEASQQVREAQEQALLGEQRAREDTGSEQQGSEEEEEESEEE
ncbi:uncharacterized protein JCM6883_004924 [Sporobolomyces salmoneus]|uniref:uncharacterized protein n=1 Tax=Sporobolomyces salmoneus TaxID=183962 RepID=UPI003179CE2A